ncbi:PIG-L family deacetylase [Streptacidiphilus sp. ASG 303]|uniref:PIG-L family deacetylase n=1 Tax=Streptacidiphilus sp. ASG 303 TaxID=2896847 RepID=UPI001E4E3E92|nr:PIG-L family deacetylase [Streptacidiphilus sp. ASG 303]MCD0485444.1 PIG-L family deacetylase [Streptacidiphilus sp. ASG 303]
MGLRRGLLAVHAHPDDESLFTGGVLAQHAAEGIPTAVVTCTDGEVAEGAPFAPPGTRAEELARALTVLRAGRPDILPYRDSGPLGRGHGSLCAAPFDALVAALVTRIRLLRPAAVATYDAFGVYGHPDHVRVHRAVLAAVHAAAHGGVQPEAGPPWEVHSVWLATVPESLVRELTALGLEAPLPCTPDDRISAAVDVRPWLDVKWEAVRAHASEFARGARISAFQEPRLRRLCLGTEWFLHHPGPAARPAAAPRARPRLLADPF